MSIIHTSYITYIPTFVKGKRLGLEHANNCQLGGSGAFPDGFPLAAKLVHQRVKGLLGLDQCKFAFTGAAPISVDTLQVRFYDVPRVRSH